MARTPKSPTQRQEPLTPGEATIADPENPAINNEENTAPDTQTTTEPVDNSENAPHKDVPKGPLPGDPVGSLAGVDVEDEVPEDQKEKTTKKKIPKVNTAEEDKPKKPVKVAAAPGEAENVAQPADNSMKDQMTPEQAIAYANTQPDPRVALAYLRRDRRLTDLSTTYEMARDQGLLDKNEE